MSVVARAAAARPVERVVRAQPADVGTFTVRRALPDRERRCVGPWVFLDHFGPFRAKAGDGVGAHPHAGIETVTYLFSGRQRHRDSAGHEGIVSAGGAQWMTAGRGVVHAETPVPATEDERVLHGVQLWTSLPRLAKMTAPGYQNLAADAIATGARDGVTLRVIGGALAGLEGPARTSMPLVLAHATLEAGAVLEAAIPEAFEMAAYVAAGEALAEGVRAGTGEMIVWGAAAPGLRLSNPGSSPLQALLLGGTPAEGPLVFHGPFVMNSIEQVRAAEVAWRTGRMGTLEER